MGVRRGAAAVMGFGILSLFMTHEVARGEVTRVATFENFVVGQSFKPSFTDPLSGITFRNSTHPNHDFAISYSGTYFGGSRYLTAGGYSTDPGGGFLGADFGFTADLPQPSSSVRLDAIAPTGTALQAFDGKGVVLAEHSVPSGVTDPFFTLEVIAAGYEIAAFRVVARPGGAAYDNIRFTVAPEPGAASIGFAAAGMLRGRRRQRR